MSRDQERPEIPRLLVVDDEVLITDAIRRFFSARRWEVDVAREREEGEALLVHRRYTAVVTDLHLGPFGEQDGLELLRLARSRALGTPVILLTGYGSSALGEAVAALGGARVLGKPVSLVTLAEEVAAVTEVPVG